MKEEETFNIPPDSYFVSDCISHDELSDDNNFLSPEVKPENIFDDQGKDNSEAQLSSKILNFPFTLDSYQLIYIKNKEDPELGGEECKIILGNLEKIRYEEPILELIFFSKDIKTPLNLNDYPNEMNSLKTNLGIEFISIFQNKLFIQCENENSTNEAYVSLQKSSTLFDLLYDEERSLNSLEEQNKGFNSGKKNNNDKPSNEEQLSDKKEKKSGLFNKFDVPIRNNKEDELFFNSHQKKIWNSNQFYEDKNTKIDMDHIKSQTISPQKQNNSSVKEDSNTKQKPPIIFPPIPFPSFLFPINNVQKTQPQINPSLLLQMTKLNPFLLQTALAMQNLIKMQQLNQKTNDSKDKKTQLNNIKDFNGKKENKKTNANNESDNYIPSNNNKESSTNSNTSSSSNESSPSSNYQPNNNINNININFNIPNINFGLFNGFNINNVNGFANTNLKNINNNANSINSNNLNKDIINNIKINENAKNNETTKNESDNNSNLEQIVLNKKYKEYIPKNIKDKEKAKDVEFHTKSTSDYKYKYVSRYIVQIENEKNFPVTKMIIGNNGKLLRKILLDNCINYGDHTTKIRLRGKGSGYKEGPKNEESKDPMELCISSLNMVSYMRCSQAIENLLSQVYYQYYLYQCNNLSSEKNDKNNNNNLNNNKEIKDKNGCPIIMKKILKYPYVVNRYNTLVKEEKRKKKEEELKQANQNNNYNSKDINHV